MKGKMVVAALAVVTQGAWAAKPCDELKGEIEARIKAKGVQQFSLEVVPVGQAAAGKVVGGCDGGSKQIVYTRGAPATPPAAPAPEAPAPQS